jgi:hypothetical protein
LNGNLHFLGFALNYGFNDFLHGTRQVASCVMMHAMGPLQLTLFCFRGLRCAITTIERSCSSLMLQIATHEAKQLQAPATRLASTLNYQKNIPGVIVYGTSPRADMPHGD